MINGDSIPITFWFFFFLLPVVQAKQNVCSQIKKNVYSSSKKKMRVSAESELKQRWDVAEIQSAEEPFLFFALQVKYYSCSLTSYNNYSQLSQNTVLSYTSTAFSALAVLIVCAVEGLTIKNYDQWGLRPFCVFASFNYCFCLFFMFRFYLISFLIVKRHWV